MPDITVSSMYIILYNNMCKHTHDGRVGESVIFGERAIVTSKGCRAYMMPRKLSTQQSKPFLFHD